ncbi:hypothetical protein MMC20_006533 [Loxospora ochrophaea]|nr:hypothetical protein [Loxospora ochrophaea]
MALVVAATVCDPKLKSRLVGPVTEFINASVELLKLSLQIATEEDTKDARWLVIHAFLWTSWQRCLMLYLWEGMSCQLEGFDYDENHYVRLRGVNFIPEIYKKLNRQQLRELRSTPYLCGWAYRSLRGDQACITMDLRHFNKRYRSCFKERLAVCNPGSRQCDGSSSQACQRFKGSPVRNQSMHDEDCLGGCQSLYWDRQSFINVSGAKAVDIKTTDSRHLRYCSVTEKTLTISHVWSHGQGGRPDNVPLEGTGFNACLHRRYAALANSMGYQSYWMDTPCIPSERDLRWECIANITRVFTISEATIVCDRDLLNVDVSDPTIETREQILAILLVCDWNIRAWTLLEAMRGRSRIYVLCRNNRLINLQENLQLVHQSGRIDLVILFLTKAYLLPPSSLGDVELFPGEVISVVDPALREGFLNIGEAAVLLSHRHATRDGDDLLIWSLLIGDVEDKSPVEMWKRQIGKEIWTGSLISSAQRISGHRSLGWAPFRPTVLQSKDMNNSPGKAYLAYDGVGTRKGLITAEGLRAKWLVHTFSSSRSTEQEERSTGTAHNADYFKQIKEITTMYLSGYQQGALLQACPAKGPRNVPVPYREPEGYVLVVCGSNSRSNSEAEWEWQDVFEWDVRIPLPDFLGRDILLV